MDRGDDLLRHLERVTHYTEYEGANWIPFESNVDTTVPDIEYTAQRHPSSILIPFYIELGFRRYEPSFYKVHSFKTTHGRRWDCINGWNKETERV